MLQKEVQTAKNRRGADWSESVLDSSTRPAGRVKREEARSLGGDLSLDATKLSTDLLGLVLDTLGHHRDVRVQLGLWGVRPGFYRFLVTVRDC